MVSQPTKTRHNALTSTNAQPTMVVVENISASINMVLINANVCLDTNLIRRKFTSTLDQWGSLQLASMSELRSYKAKHVVSSTGYDMLKPLSTI